MWQQVIEFLVYASVQGYWVWCSLYCPRGWYGNKDV